MKREERIIYFSQDPARDGVNWMNYCNSNPVTYTDPDGRDIILLSDPDRGAGQSHNAVLVGNDKDGWHYFSKDGGDKNNVHLTFSNLNDFKNWNTKLNTLFKKHAYDKAFKITTDKEQDNEAIQFGIKNFDKPYSLTEHKDENGNVIDQNCADLAADIISAAGLEIQKPKIDRKAKSKYYGCDRYYDAFSHDKLSTVTCPEYQFKLFSNKYKDVGNNINLINKD